MWNLWKFSKQLLPRATFGEHSVSGAALVKPYLNNKYLVHKTNKHPFLVVRAILWSNFPLPPSLHPPLPPPKKNPPWNILKKSASWGLATIKPQVKVTKAGFQHFSWTFSTFSEQPFCRRHTNNFFWSLDVFLVYDRKALLSFLSESATRWNSEELLL